MSKVSRIPIFCLLGWKFSFLFLPSYEVRSPAQLDLPLVHSRLSRDFISGDRQTQSLSDYSNFSITGMGIISPQPWLLWHFMKSTGHWTTGWLREADNLLNALTTPALKSWKTPFNAARTVMLYLHGPKSCDMPQRERCSQNSPVITQCGHLSPEAQRFCPWHQEKSIAPILSQTEEMGFVML